jgi:hypothetical protein
VEFFFLWRLRCEAVCQDCGLLQQRHYREFRKLNIPKCPRCGGHVRAPEADERDGLCKLMSHYGVGQKRGRYRGKFKTKKNAPK